MELRWTNLLNDYCLVRFDQHCFMLNVEQGQWISYIYREREAHTRKGNWESLPAKKKNKESRWHLLFSLPNTKKQILLSIVWPAMQAHLPWQRPFIVHPILSNHFLDSHIITNTYLHTLSSSLQLPVSYASFPFNHHYVLPLRL